MEQIFAASQEKMNKTIAALETEFASVRAGRANAAVLERVTVDYYGSPTPINQLATISTPEARSLLIQPWDKGLLKPIERAIQSSDIGINPQNDGVCLRLIFPPLNEERRRELSKLLFKYAEEGKVAIRSIRRDALEKLKDQKKKSEITEDDLKKAEKQMQDLTDKFCKKIDDVTAAKEKEIMEI